MRAETYVCDGCGVRVLSDTQDDTLRQWGGLNLSIETRFLHSQKITRNSWGAHLCAPCFDAVQTAVRQLIADRMKGSRIRHG